MTGLSNYYERSKTGREINPSDRYPANHVKFSTLLSLLSWIDGVYGLFGKKAFMMTKAMLREFDRATPLDKYLGEKEDIANIRRLLLSHSTGIDKNQNLSPIGRFLLKTIGLEAIKNRRRVLQFYKKNKSFIEANGRFETPLIIAGSPRSGTTLLQRLMSEDPNSRSPYTFELELPIPPLTKESDPMKDNRINKSNAAIKTFAKLAPGFMEKFAESHVWSATEMEETIDYTLAHNGITQMNGPLAGMSHIRDMLKVEDKRSLFLYERLFFTLLDAYRPARSHWVLKATEYARYFPLIFEEYHDANIVLTHRNPLITLPSLCRLWESWCIAFDRTGTFDKHNFGMFIKIIQERYLSVPLAYRKKHPEIEAKIFDCLYDKFFCDPIDMVKRIYQKFNLEYTKEFEARMKIYLKNNQQGKYGRHKYSLQEYGFDAGQLYEEFNEYMKHYNFNIPARIERPASFDFLKNY